MYVYFLMRTAYMSGIIFMLIICMEHIVCLHISLKECFWVETWGWDIIEADGKLRRIWMTVGMFSFDSVDIFIFHLFRVSRVKLRRASSLLTPGYHCGTLHPHKNAAWLLSGPDARIQVIVNQILVRWNVRHTCDDGNLFLKI